jgi:hypothetical protein
VPPAGRFRWIEGFAAAKQRHTCYLFQAIKGTSERLDQSNTGGYAVDSRRFFPAMQNTTAFVEILDAADRLSLDEQQTLVEILQRRMVEHRREELAAEIRDAEEEYQAGRCRPVTPEELMGEVLS